MKALPNDIVASSVMLFENKQWCSCCGVGLEPRFLTESGSLKSTSIKTAEWRGLAQTQHDKMSCVMKKQDAISRWVDLL